MLYISHTPVNKYEKYKILELSMKMNKYKISASTIKAKKCDRLLLFIAAPLRYF